MTPSIQRLLDQTAERREKQDAYNKEHGIIPETIKKGRNFTIGEIVAPDSGEKKKHKMPQLAGTMFTDATDISALGLSETDLEALVGELTGEMRSAAEALEFERAANLRDQIRKLHPEKKS
ncbi:UvrABC system protein B [bioreactor metagenome]|uniref:UvrABC system protein B n=1 Tax=bioreactor metagenome TaxID=1076179 RepID=A0A645HKR2_9ZZZZ